MKHTTARSSFKDSGWEGEVRQRGRQWGGLTDRRGGCMQKS